jgi:hypothetical protein
VVVALRQILTGRYDGPCTFAAGLLKLGVIVARAEAKIAAMISRLLSSGRMPAKKNLDSLRVKRTFLGAMTGTMTWRIVAGGNVILIPTVCGIVRVFRICQVSLPFSRPLITGEEQLIANELHASPL